MATHFQLALEHVTGALKIVLFYGSLMRFVIALP